jgi:hypothetical protein
MLISSQYLIRQSSTIRSSLINSCHCYQSTNTSLSSILFPEPKPAEKSETPPPKTTTKQQAQAVVSSAADAAVNVLGVGWGALNAVSNRITGLTSSSRKVQIENEHLKSIVRIITPDTLEQRTKSVISSVKTASSTLSQATRIEQLSNHLLYHPDANYYTKKVSNEFYQKLKFPFLFLPFRNVLYLIYFIYVEKNIVNLLLINHLLVSLMNVLVYPIMFLHQEAKVFEYYPSMEEE